MNRSNSTYSRHPEMSGSSRAAGPAHGSRTRFAGGFTDVETDAQTDDVGSGRTYAYAAGSNGVRDYQDYGDYEGEHDDFDEVYEYRDEIDRRWIWVAGVAGAILLVAVVCTAVILGGGDSGSVSKTIAPPTPSAAPTATATAPPSMTKLPPAVPPPAPLSPETVTTVAPSPTASVAPPPVAVAPAANTFTYRVTGSRQLIDLVTVVYTDQQGALQTEFNVALPWSRTVTLDPGVALTSVTATSLMGQLNCSISDSAGTPVVAQANNSMIATCTK